MRSKLISSATIANVFAAGVALYCVLSSTWVWARTVDWNWTSTSSSTMGTGPYVLSHSSSSVSSAFSYKWASYSLWYSDVNDSACSSTNSVMLGVSSSTNAYYAFGQYGFCSGINGTFTVPTNVVHIRLFNWLAFSFALLASVFGCMVQAKGKRFAIFGALISFFAMAFAVTTFSLAASDAYFAALRNGSAGLLVPATSGYAIVNGVSGMWWGPSFYAMILVFVIELYATFKFISASRGANATPDDEQLDVEAAQPYQQEVYVSQPQPYAQQQQQYPAFKVDV